jgi:hypothetical protein
MLKTTLHLTAVLALVLLGARTEAQMPNAAPTASNGWITNDWPAPQATLRRLPRCEDDLNLGIPMLMSMSATRSEPFVTAKTVNYEGLVDLGGDGKCDVKGKDYVVSSPPAWAHRCAVFGELLLIRPRDAEVAFGVPIDGDIEQASSPVQMGPVGIVDPDHSSGFRAGFSIALDWCRSIVMTYSMFESHTDSQMILQDPESVIAPLVMHPGTINAGDFFLSASAGLGVDYDLVDADYRSLLSLGRCHVVSWFVGARYGRLRQNMITTYTLTGTTESVLSDIVFEGGGIRFGLDGERHNRSGLLLYGRSVLSLVAGESTAIYQQGEDFDSAVVDTEWKAGRIVPIVDLEVGAGWQSPCGRFRLSAGYQINYWFNTVTTDQWIRAVQSNSFVGQPDGMSYDTISFDGLVARAEYRF